MRIELLHIIECPSWSTCLKSLQHALIDLDLNAEMKVQCLESSNLNEFVQFHGSPTILVDGQDIFPVDDYVGDLSCRVYNTPEGLRGMPTTEQIVQQLQKLIKEKLHEGDEPTS